MAIIIRDVIDDEIPRACEIEALAFKDNDIGPILMPGARHSNSREQRVQQVIDMREDPTVIFKQAFDEETGTMIAFAKWVFLETSEAAAKFSRPLRFDNGRNAEACMLFFGGLADKHKEHIGDKPHIFLHIIQTDPEFQRRGAGSMLLDWGVQKSNELGIPIYLESSTKAHQFYKKHGFKDIEIVEMDFTKWGGHVHQQPLMTWEPAKLA